MPKVFNRNGYCSPDLDPKSGESISCADAVIITTTIIVAIVTTIVIIEYPVMTCVTQEAGMR